MGGAWPGVSQLRACTTRPGAVTRRNIPRAASHLWSSADSVIDGVHGILAPYSCARMRRTASRRVRQQLETVRALLCEHGPVRLHTQAREQLRRQDHAQFVAKSNQFQAKSCHRYLRHAGRRTTCIRIHAQRRSAEKPADAQAPSTSTRPLFRSRRSRCRGPAGLVSSRSLVHANRVARSMSILVGSRMTRLAPD